MHVNNAELFTFNRILLACFHLHRRGLHHVHLFMQYFRDVDFLRECYIDGGNNLRHQLRVPKDALWEAHYRRQEKAQKCFTNRELKQICSRARTPNEHFWAKAHFPGGTEAVEELAEGVRDLLVKHDLYGPWKRRIKKETTRQYIVATALAEVLLRSCRGRRNRKTAEQLLEAVLEFIMAYPESCCRVPKSVTKLRKRLMGNLINWRRRTHHKKRFQLGDKVYRFCWAEEPGTGRGWRGFTAHWLELES